MNLKNLNIPMKTDKTTVIHGEQHTLNAELQKAKEQEACLIIIRGTPQGSRFFLTHPIMVIGRDPAADISTPDQSISRRHAEIRKNGKEVTLVDLGSSNGTVVNDVKLQSGESILLAKEDMIKLGNTIFKFLPAGEIEILFYGNLGLAAHTDPLTRIYNKGYLMEAIEAEFKRAKALHTDFSIIFFDLDHFKNVNDTFGHDAGDYILKEVCNIIRTEYVRPKDIFARYGGEEFVILLANTSAQAAADVAEKFRSAVETHIFAYDEKRVPVTVSIGVSELRTDISSSQTLLKLADQALYEAKSNGRNRVVVHA